MSSSSAICPSPSMSMARGVPGSFSHSSCCKMPSLFVSCRLMNVTAYLATFAIGAGVWANAEGSNKQVIPKCINSVLTMLSKNEKEHSHTSCETFLSIRLTALRIAIALASIVSVETPCPRKVSTFFVPSGIMLG